MDTTKHDTLKLDSRECILARGVKILEQEGQYSGKLIPRKICFLLLAEKENNEFQSRNATRRLSIPVCIDGM